MLLLGFSIIKSETKKVEEITMFSNELRGFEADYLSKAEFRKQVKENKQIFGWIIDTVVNWVASWFSDSYGEYNDDTQNTEGPYFLFTRTPNGLTPEQQLTELRRKIISKEDNYQDIYKQILDDADKSVNNCTGSKGVCEGSLRAKCAAFVYVVGIKKNLITGLYEQMPYNDPDRFAYRTKVVNYLKNVEGYDLLNWYDDLLNGVDFFIPFGLGEGTVGGLAQYADNVKENMQYRSKELLMIIQALDLIEWAHKLDPALPNSELPGQNRVDVIDMKNRIKRNYVVPMYRRANVAFGGTFDSGNNFALMTGGSIGAASIALRFRGDEFTKTYAHPSRWANASLAAIHSAMWDDGLFENSMSRTGEQFGYIEGPHYFRYGFENLLPYFKARYNLKPTNFSNSYYRHVIDLAPKYVRNQFFDADYDNIYKWYNNITMPNGQAVSYDESWANCYFNGVFAIRGQLLDGTPSLNWQTNPVLMGLIPVTVDLRADYLASLNPPYNHNYPRSSDLTNDKVIRYNMDEDITKQYFLHLNAKKPKSVSLWHEHADIGHFTVSAGTDILTMDPAHWGDGTNANVKEGKHHNTILIDGVGPDESDYANNCSIDQTGKSIKLKYKYSNYTLGFSTSLKTTLERTITFHDETTPYYTINDWARNENWFDAQNISFHLNGNGNDADINNISFYKHTNTVDFPNTYIWDYPCKMDDYPDDNYKMQATFSLVNSSATVIFSIGRYPNGNTGQVLNPIDIEIGGGTHKYNNFITEPANLTPKLTVGSGESYGNHNYVDIKIEGVDPKEKANFLTSIQMIPCSKTVNPPKFKSTPRYTSHTFTFFEPDTTINYHYSRIDQAPVVDTTMNPLGINPNAVFETDAVLAFFKYSTDREFKTGNCYTFTNFRKARIETGRELSYNDTTYILSTKYASTYYSLEGKYKYKGYVQTDTACDVKLYLADVDTNFAMAAVGISFNYNDTTHIMTLHAPVGNTNFTVELADPCLMSCFFPYTTDSIKNTFDFATGTKETLPHKLTITTPNGYLKIRNGSHMQICSGKWLRNKDSLILDYRCPEDADQGKGLVVCPDVTNRLNLTNPPPTISQLYPSTDDYTPSQITVNSYAALILDSGSYTRFGNNTKLNIKPYASLIIRKNAKLDIGDAKSCGHAEIICEPNSYVHFEDSADIKFWQMKDTNDIHLFYISLKPQATAAHAGIEPAMLDMLLNTDNIIDTSIAHAEPICEVAKIRADYGINNRDWGFGNFIKPKAWAYIPKDTFCPGECPIIIYDRMLNDVKRGITICRIDTDHIAMPPQIIFVNCYVPNIPGGNIGSTYSSGDACDTLQNSKPITLCNPIIGDPGYWYRVFLSSYNDCDQLDTMKLYYFNMPAITPEFTLPDTGCTGKGSVLAYENNDYNSYYFRQKTKWHVHVIDGSAPNVYVQQVQYGGDWEYLKGAYPGTFTFPNFTWVGGFRYAVSHTLSTSGCRDTTMWDTIMIVPGAHIKAVKPTLYDNKIGDVHEIQLDGMIKNATSFTWSPSLGLNRTDTLSVLCNTNEDKTYTLSAYYGSCVEHDNVTIRHNTASYLGTNDTICMAGNSVILGNRYNAAMFLGWLNNSSALGIKDRLVRVFTNADGSMAEVDINYLRYFNAFMYTPTFAQSQREGWYPYYDIFTSDSIFNWEQLFRHPFFKTYYYNYLNNMNAQFDALDDFNTFIQTSENIEIFQLNQIDESSNSCFTNLFSDYNTFYNNIISNEDPANNGVPSITWYKIVGKDTSAQNQWQDMFIVIDTPVATTTYIQQVIHANSSLVEYDIRTIYIDTGIVSLFYPTMQWDSSVYFTNATSPSSSTNKYLWDFGDGSATSTDVNPFHTFPAFNTHYVVCLTATNHCGNYTYCDTVWIDSLHLGGSFRVTKGLLSGAETNKSETDLRLRSEDVSGNASKSTMPITNGQQPIALSNYPNPFDQSTIIDYEIWQTYTKAELRITNVLGQEVYSQKLNRPMDKIQIDGSALHGGLYYYSLIVDDAVKLTKTMSVMR